jgi:hypothetical protein
MSASHDIRMCGRCLRLNEEGVESGPIASRCCAGLRVPGFDGYGTVKTTSGPKYTVNTRRDGYTSMPVKKLGTNQGNTQKVSQRPHFVSRLSTDSVQQAGVRRSHTALPFPSMALQMSLAATSETQLSMVSIGHGVRKKYSFGSSLRYAEYAGKISTKRLGDAC